MEGQPDQDPVKAIGSLRKMLNNKNEINHREKKEEDRLLMQKKEERRQERGRRQAKRLDAGDDTLHWSDAETE